MSAIADVEKFETEIAELKDLLDLSRGNEARLTDERDREITFRVNYTDRVATLLDKLDKALKQADFYAEARNEARDELATVTEERNSFEGRLVRRREERDDARAQLAIARQTADDAEVCLDPRRGGELREEIAALHVEIDALHKRLGTVTAELAAVREELVETVAAFDSSYDPMRRERDALRAEVERKNAALERIVTATVSHVDGRSYLDELHPRHQLDIIRRLDGVEERFEGDWLSALREAVNAAIESPRPTAAVPDPFEPLSEEALAKVQPMTGAEIKEALAQGRRDLDGKPDPRDAEIDRLRGLVGAAYRRGYDDGWNDNSGKRHDPGHAWDCSGLDEALEQDQTPTKPAGEDNQG